MTRSRDGSSRVLADGLRLAVTTFTVLPVRPGRINRRTAGVAVSLAPLPGAVLGAVLGGLALLVHLGAPPLLTGVVTVAAGALLTRGLHLDGLADTLDGLGSYADRERALAIMKQPDVGPFGVAGIVLILLAQVAAVAELAIRGWLPAVVGVAVSVTTGRLAVTVACRRGVPAAWPDGLGALVAGTVPGPVPYLWLLGVAVAAVVATPEQPWRGPVAVLAGVAVAAMVTRHAVRRFGGVTGDVLGAVLEIATAVSLAVLAAA